MKYILISSSFVDSFKFLNYIFINYFFLVALTTKDYLNKKFYNFNLNKIFCLKKNLLVLQFKNKFLNFLNYNIYNIYLFCKIKKIYYDFFVIFNYFYIFHDEFLILTKFIILNIHGCLLPNLRGSNPINYNLINNNYCGLSLIIISKNIDCGKLKIFLTLPIKFFYFFLFLKLKFLLFINFIFFVFFLKYLILFCLNQFRLKVSYSKKSNIYKIF